MSKMFLTKVEAKKEYEKLQNNDFKCPEIVDSNFKSLREDIFNSYQNIKNMTGSDYLKDLKFALDLFVHNNQLQESLQKDIFLVKA